MSEVILDVVGATETAQILGVELQRISRWRTNGRLPPPYVKLRLGPIWTRKDVEALRDGIEVEFTAPQDPPPLLGTAEVAKLLDVDKSQIARWRSRPNKTGPMFPEARTRVKAGPLWVREDVEHFAEHRSPRRRKAKSG